MKAIQFDPTILHYTVSKAIGRFFPSVFFGPMSCLSYRDVEEPSFPNQEWVKVRVTYYDVSKEPMGRRCFPWDCFDRYRRAVIH